MKPFIFENQMSRGTHDESGWSKLKRKAKREEEKKKLPKIDNFFQKENLSRKSEPAESSSSQTSVIEESQTGSPIESLAVTETAGTSVVIPINDNTVEIEKTLGSKNLEFDVGHWSNLSEEEISIWIQRGPEKCQNWTKSFEKSKRIFLNQTRYCSNGLFFSEKPNGKKIKREWLVYSALNGKVYCFVCKLLSSSST